MARIKINIPEKAIGNIKIPIRINDINYGNHLGNDALVSIIHEARVQWLRQFNYTELNIEGIGLIMADLAVEYKNESFYGDMLDVTISVDEISKIGFDLFFSISNQKNILIAKAKTGMVCYDYENKKVAAIPDNFKKNVLEY
ncbi:MAG: thioesterase family protein [Ferruginibacter sp.]